MTRMEELTQTQIILLTLLVSFITSIATGIITTSLLAEAPTSVTQTINRVVEHTIETVAPSATSTNSNINVSTSVKEITFVKEDDAIISAIDKVSKGVVRINTQAPGGGAGEFYGLGVIVRSDGLIISDLRNSTAQQLYLITLPDGNTVTAHVVNVGTADNLGVFKIDPDQKYSTYPTITISPNQPMLGQTAISIEGKEKNSVDLGRVLSLKTGIEKNDKGENINVAYAVTTDINLAGELPGSPLINLSGDLIGIKTSNNDLSLTSGIYTTAVPINRAIEKAR